MKHKKFQCRYNKGFCSIKGDRLGCKHIVQVRPQLEKSLGLSILKEGDAYMWVNAERIHLLDSWGNWIDV